MESKKKMCTKIFEFYCFKEETRIDGIVYAKKRQLKDSCGIGMEMMR